MEVKLRSKSLSLSPETSDFVLHLKSLLDGCLINGGHGNNRGYHLRQRWKYSNIKQHCTLLSRKNAYNCVLFQCTRTFTIAEIMIMLLSHK